MSQPDSSRRLAALAQYIAAVREERGFAVDAPSGIVARAVFDTFVGDVRMMLGVVATAAIQTRLHGFIDQLFGG